MKILVTPTSLCKNPDTQELSRLKEFADEIIYNPYGRPLSEGEMLALLPGVDGILAGLDYITAKVIQKAPKTLKVISRYGAGFDRVDIQAAGENGIVVTNTPGANAIAVAELTLGLILAVARKISVLDSQTKQGHWVRSTGMELHGKTLGLIGLGAIGKKVVPIAKGFNLNIIGYDSFIDKDFVEAYGVQMVTNLDELFQKSDIITLHIPANKETTHLINRSSISKMKKGVILINTSRGELIDDLAVYEGLKNGKIGGLGTDVFTVEPPINNPLLELDHVVATPHTASHTHEATEKMATMAIENLITVLGGEKSPYIVNQAYLEAYINQ